MHFLAVNPTLPDGLDQSGIAGFLVQIFLFGVAIVAIVAIISGIRGNRGYGMNYLVIAIVAGIIIALAVGGGVFDIGESFVELFTN